MQPAFFLKPMFLLTALVLLGTLIVLPAQTASNPARYPCRFEEATSESDQGAIDPHQLRLQSDHLKRLGVDRWHKAGFRGQGVKIAVLDTGFRGYRAHLGRALPARVITRSFRQDGNLEAKDSQHGIMCGEVLHALAPEAELLLANWDPEFPEQFLDAALWARQQGARIISCSVIMPSCSDGEGHGQIDETLAQIIGTGDTAQDLLCFASAGNTALRHWYGPFRDGGRGLHQWRPGLTVNQLTPWGYDPVSVELYWHVGSQQYDLFVRDAATNTEVGRSQWKPGAPDRGRAVVHFEPRPTARYEVEVRLARGESGPFHLVVLGGNLSCATARSSVACPADGTAVLAVGAVHKDGRRAGYSSCGPNSSRPKPDLVAVVPFPSLWRGRPFTGTSAAAPQAAALAALLWSCHPAWTPDQVRKALLSSALDLNLPGPDFETGYGLVTLPNERIEPVPAKKTPLRPR